AEIGGAENTKWMVDMAQRGTEPLQMRRRALEAANRAGASITSLIGLYDTTTDPSMKQTLVDIYVRNGERPAVDKLLSILKSEENMSVRRNAISRMSHSEDPRIKAALLDIVSK